MAHKTLVGGTAYNITGGKSMVSGTTYNISGGRTLVGGTGYNISFSGGEPTAMLYSDGTFVFQEGDIVEEGKTLTASYTDFNITTSPPWFNSSSTFTTVRFDTEIAPVGMYQWFSGSRNMTSNIDNFTNLNMKFVTTMGQTFKNCKNLTGSPVCGANVTNMSDTYSSCYKLTGSPVCGDNVIIMYYAYSNCRNLTGSPVCGANVTTMYYTYYNCSNLTGSPACGNKVTTMYYTYYNCSNLTGSPACGANVTNMRGAYSNCSSLTGSPVCGANVTDMTYTYDNCKNLAGNAYFYSSIINNARGCFRNKNNSKRLNIYVPINSTTQTTVLSISNYSLVNNSIFYTKAGTYHYNTAYNIYIYPVENVAAAAIANGDEEANANAGIIVNVNHGGGTID